MIIVVSIPSCTWCDRVKALLKMQGVAFDERCLDDPAAQAAFCREHQTTTFPQVFHQDFCGLIGGFTATQRWVAEGGHLNG